MTDISNIIARFANSFDEKNWEAMASLLADQIEVDYTDLRGTNEIVTRDEYVSKRKEALAELHTHHLFANLEISENAGKPRCKATGLIYRALGERFFNSHVVYDFELARSGSVLKITRIRQTVLWHEGDPSIHKGARANVNDA